MTDDTCFGALVRAHRLRVGMTQRALADLSTVSIRTIRDLERGRVGQPRQETVRLIADALRLGPKTRAELENAANRAGPGWAPNTVLAPTAAIGSSPAGRQAATAELERELLLGVLVRVVGPRGVDESRLPADAVTLLHALAGMPVPWTTAPDGASWIFVVPAGYRWPGRNCPDGYPIPAAGSPLTSCWPVPGRGCPGQVTACGDGCGTGRCWPWATAAGTGSGCPIRYRLPPAATAAELPARLPLSGSPDPQSCH